MSIKDLFVKTEETPDMSPIGKTRPTTRATIPSVPTQSMPEVDISSIDMSGVVPVQDIYQKVGMGDLSKSIFRVEEIKSVVPADLPTEAKRKTVLGMLPISGLEITSLLADASDRQLALENFSDQAASAAMMSIQDAEEQISDLEAKIDAFRQRIADTKKTQEGQQNIIKGELAKITEIVKFISPVPEVTP